MQHATDENDRADLAITHSDVTNMSSVTSVHVPHIEANTKAVDMARNTETFKNRIISP
jgi:hypothetical protein